LFINDAINIDDRLMDKYKAVGVVRISRGYGSRDRKSAPIPTLSVTNVTLPDLGLNSRNRGGKSAQKYRSMIESYMKGFVNAKKKYTGDTSVNS
jgi:hypothetical protein